MKDVITKYERVPAEIIEAYKSVGESASINEALPDKDGALDSKIKPIWTDCKTCGAALTVQCWPGDNLMLHKAISMLSPNDVLVVVNGGYDEAGGMFGEIMASCVVAKKGAGLVIEGACRDTVAIRKMGLPVFATNVSIKPTTKALPGKINHPVIIGGVSVEPGDLIFGDNDGIVVVPKALAAEVLEKVQKREKNEAAMLEKIARGELITFDAFKKAYDSLGLSED